MAAKSKSKVKIGHVFKTLIWPRKNILLVGLVLIIISRLSSLVLPGASKYLMDDVIAKGNIEMLKMIINCCRRCYNCSGNNFFFINKIIKRGGTAFNSNTKSAAATANSKTSHKIF